MLGSARVRRIAVLTAAEADSLDASAEELDVGPLTLRNATLRKRGSELTGSATVTEANLRSAVFFTSRRSYGSDN